MIISNLIFFCHCKVYDFCLSIVGKFQKGAITLSLGNIVIWHSTCTDLINTRILFNLLTRYRSTHTSFLKNYHRKIKWQFTFKINIFVHSFSHWKPYQRFRKYETYADIKSEFLLLYISHDFVESIIVKTFIQEIGFKFKN